MNVRHCILSFGISSQHPSNRESPRSGPFLSMGCGASVQDSQLQLYDFDGVLAQQWALPASICYAKAHVGAGGGESVLLGLTGGALVQAVPGKVDFEALLSHGTSIRSDYFQYRW